MNDRVIVVGAGLAGLAAARSLIEAGIETLVLEARDRVGGRTWTAGFESAGLNVDLGAEWVSPNSHHAVMAELARYDLAVCDPATGLVPSWHIGGRLILGSEPLRGNEVDEFAAALQVMDADAALIDFQDSAWHRPVTDLDIPFSTYLDSIGVRGVVRERILVRSFALMGAPADGYSALNMLHEIAGFSSAHEAFYGDSRRIAGGTDSIARAIESEVGGVIRFSTPVRSIRHTAGGVEVVTDKGAFEANAVIVAIPVNVLHSIKLDVSLSPAALKAIQQGQGGQVAKVWATADGLPNPYMSLAWPKVPEAYGLKGTKRFAVAGFELVDPAADTEHDVLETLRTRHPEATFGSQTLWHNWVADPWARGSWQAARPGQAAAWYDLAASPGPCLFAGGDLSRRWAGWMDGALTSGADAAKRAKVLIQTGSVPAVAG